MLRLLIYCATVITSFSFPVLGQKTNDGKRKASILYCDSATLKSYQDELSHDSDRYDTAFIHEFFRTIHEFNGRTLDTTITTSGKLDEKGNDCIIRTRVYLFKDTVFVDSKLIMNHELLWKYSFEDPWRGGREGEPKLFDWETRNLWVFFTCGIYNGPPEFVDYKTTAPEIFKSFSSDGKMVIENDIDDSKNKGINITEKQLRSYLKNFKGDLFAFGDFINREKA